MFVIILKKSGLVVFTKALETTDGDVLLTIKDPIVPIDEFLNVGMVNVGIMKFVFPEIREHPAGL